MTDLVRTPHNRSESAGAETQTQDRQKKGTDKEKRETGRQTETDIQTDRETDKKRRTTNDRVRPTEPIRERQNQPYK